MPPELVSADRSHLHLLQRFVCADPEKPRFNGTRVRTHPAMWAVDVQSHLRSLVPPVADDEMLWLLVSEDRVHAASHFAYTDDPAWKILAIGVNVEDRGMQYGSMMLGLTLDIMRATDATLPVITEIDYRNVRSKALCAENHFVPIPQGNRDELELWGRDLQ